MLYVKRCNVDGSNYLDLLLMDVNKTLTLIKLVTSCHIHIISIISLPSMARVCQCLYRYVQQLKIFLTFLAALATVC